MSTPEPSVSSAAAVGPPGAGPVHPSTAGVQAYPARPQAEHFEMQTLDNMLLVLQAPLLGRLA